jgi:hypothetical protein
MTASNITALAASAVLEKLQSFQSFITFLSSSSGLDDDQRPPVYKIV